MLARLVVVRNDGDAQLVLPYMLVVGYIVVVVHHSMAQFALVAGNRRANLSHKTILGIVGIADVVGIGDIVDIVDIVAHMMPVPAIFVDSLPDTSVCSVPGIHSVLKAKKLTAIGMVLDFGVHIEVGMLAGWDFDMMLHMEPDRNLHMQPVNYQL